MWIIQYIILFILFIAVFVGTGLLVVTFLWSWRSGEIKQLLDDLQEKKES